MAESKECQIAIACEDCVERKVDFLCSCDKRICENCLGKHKKANPHHFASAYSVGQVSTKIGCEKHIGEICRLFCKDCCEPVCTICTKIEHREHNYEYLADRFASQRTVMEKELQKLEMEYRNKYLKLLSENEQTISEVPEKYSAIRQEVEIAGITLQKKVETKVKKLKMQIDAMEMDHLDCLTDNKTKLEKVIENIEESKSEISRQMADPECLAAYQVKNYPFEHCPELMGRIPPELKQSENDCFNLEELLGMLTSSKKIITSKLHEEKHVGKDENKKSKAIILLEHANQMQKIVTVYSYIFDVMVTMNDTILVCGTYKIQKSLTIRSLDFSGEEIMSIPVQNQPKYLSQANDKTIFYTSDNKPGVHIIKNGTTETIAVDVSWKPKGLSCRNSGDIIVAEHNEVDNIGRLSIYTSKGEVKQSFGSENGLAKPSYVCENINSDICTSDEGKHMVFVFYSAGNLKNVYKGKSDKTEFTSFTPRGLATD
ncbi:E3 ubiquitin-protein ligase TRIM71-like, partial [Saccostrea cucullata]|uniref:E3 ubiquitin-protein ligase TRIM71-like n=1 Tax=Saccostrea cuccullata TaxID=36930 RepID=UPI002ED1E4F7